MWVRAVAVALVVGCVSGAAMAAGYTEVWNPPEASKPLKQRQGDVKVRTGAGSKHVAGMQHKPSKVASAAVHGERAATHPGVKKVSAKAGGKQPGMKPGMSKVKPKAAVVAQANKPQAQRVGAQGAQGGVMHANLDSGRSTHPHAVNVSAKPAVSHPHAPVALAARSAGPANADSNPAMASSGSLPPIIH